MKKLIVRDPAVSVCEECATRLWPGRGLRRRAADPPTEQSPHPWDPRYRWGLMSPYPDTQTCYMCGQGCTAALWVLTNPG